MKISVFAILCAANYFTSSAAFSVSTSHQQRQWRSLPVLFASQASEAETGVVVKHLPNSAVEVKIPVPGKATKAAYEKVSTELSKTLQIPGFRKGAKIPPQVLEQFMAGKGGRNAIKVQAINDLVTQLVEPTLKEYSLDPIGQAVLTTSAEELATTYTPGEPLVLELTCDIWPEIKWAGGSEEKAYVGLTAKYSRKPFNQARLDMALRDLKERYATLTPIDEAGYALQMGDACVVQMDGYMANADGSKGEPLPNAASGDRVEVILGPGRYMEGLVEGLVGAKVGDTVTVKVSFPEKLRDKTLAGKPAVFDVQVLEASKRTVPDVTDEFANQVRAGLTAESMMAELRKAIDDEDAKEFVPERNKALGESLAKVCDVDVPDTLVTNQARERFAVMMADMRDNGVADEELKKQINPENFLKYKKIVQPQIERDFKISMATDEVARLENINVASYQVDEQMESIRKDAAANKEEFDEAMIRAKVENTIRRQMTMDWLAERAQLDVEYKEETFDADLMQKIAEESLAREKELLEATDVDVSMSEQAEGKKEDTPVIQASATSVVDESVETHVSSAASTVESASGDDEEARQARYAAMSLEDRAYQILKDLGTLDQLK